MIFHPGQEVICLAVGDWTAPTKKLFFFNGREKMTGPKYNEVVTVKEYSTSGRHFTCWEYGSRTPEGFILSFNEECFYPLISTAELEKALQEINERY